MNQDDSCLTDEVMAAFMSGAGAPEGMRERFEGHLAACGACRARWAMSGAGEEDDPEEDLPFSEDPVPDIGLVRAAVLSSRRGQGANRSEPSRRFPPRRWAAAAGVLLLVGLSLLFLPSPLDAPRSRFLPPAQPIAGRNETVRAPRGGDAESVQLPDGTRLRLSPGSEARFEEPSREGDRFLVHLVRGVLDADVEKGAGALRIRSDAGEIRILGTVFKARAFRLGAGRTPVLSVEVVEGAVELADASGPTVVRAGRRGILRRGSAPELQEALPVDWRAAALRWGKDLGKAEDGWNAAYLLGSSWEGLDDWETVLDRREADPDLRRIAAELVGLSAEPEDFGRLRARFLAEGDDGVRLALLPQLVRIAGGAADAFLRDVRERDPSEAVRRAAAR